MDLRKALAVKTSQYGLVALVAVVIGLSPGHVFPRNDWESWPEPPTETECIYAISEDPRTGGLLCECLPEGRY